MTIWGRAGTMQVPVAVLAKKIWGGGSERQENIVSSIAIISSRWKNWPKQKVGAVPPGPSLEPPLAGAPWVPVGSHLVKCFPQTYSL